MGYSFIFNKKLIEYNYKLIIVYKYNYKIDLQ
jgi:hypothetical protein